MAGFPRLRYVEATGPRPPAQMDFRILGPLEALDHGDRVALGGSKRRAVLALLLVHANETVATDRLVDELWGEQPPATAAKTVQVHISRLRRALGGDNGGPDLLVTREHGYQLSIDPDRIDAHRFERLLAQGRSELAAGHAEAALSALEGALALWRGQPYADLAYEPFLQGEVAPFLETEVEFVDRLPTGPRAKFRVVEPLPSLEIA